MGDRCGYVKKNGEPCKLWPIKGRTRCGVHGGKTVAAGPGHHSYKHGKWSRWQGKLGSQVAEALADPDLCDMTQPLGVLRAAVERNLELVEERDTPEFRQRAKALHSELLDAILAADANQVMAKARALGNLLDKGAEEALSLQTLSSRAMDYCKAQESFWRVQLSGKQSVPVMDVVRIVANIARVLRQELDRDDSTRCIARIGREVVGELRGPGSGDPLAAPGD